jgi:predicted phage terminase large subunit-like protein
LKSFEFYLKRQAQEKLRAKGESEMKRQADEKLVDFERRISPRIAGTAFEPPVHFQRTIDRLDTVGPSPVRLLWSAPPRHGKSELLFHSLAKHIATYPELLCAYFSYSDEIAADNSRAIRDYAIKAGVKLRQDQRAAGLWRTTEGGGLLAGGIGGKITGKGIYYLVIDDPHKSRAEAESPAIRSRVVEWASDTAMQRVEPGASVVICHTIWHPDDTISTLKRRSGWTYDKYSAIDEEGKALWPSRWPVDALNARRAEVGEYAWASIYQGEPRPRGENVFNGTEFYEGDPPSGLRLAVGIDLAYTQKTYSDSSVAVVLGMDRETDKFYVLDVIKHRCAAPEFAVHLRTLLAQYGWPPVFSYIGGTERGATDFMVTQGIKVHAEPAKADKFVRAQPVAAAWNAQRVLLPRSSAWGDTFISEILSFTGVGDKHDDQVDALAGAYFKLAKPPPARAIGNKPLFSY